MKKAFESASGTLFSWLVALTLTAATVWLVGENPLNVFRILFHSAFGSIAEGTVGESISYTLHYATPMIFTATAVSIALEAGLFNIGAEGQLYVGALFAAIAGIATRDYIAPGLAGVALVLIGSLALSFLGGALWGGIAGYLKTRRQTHEVIVTILLNFIAYALCNWAILNPLKNQETQNLETLAIGEAFRIPKLWNHLSYGFPLALLVSFMAFWSLKKTWWGFRVRATGANAIAAKLAGVRTQSIGLATLALSGGVAGLVGFNEVFLNSYKLFDAFSPSFGFTGLAIALLARGSLLNLWFCALVFAALHKGTLDLDLETEKVTRDMAAVIQALVLVALAAQPALKKLSFKRSSGNG